MKRQRFTLRCLLILLSLYSLSSLLTTSARCSFGGPSGSLIESHDGNLYGTSSGAPVDVGVQPLGFVFKMNTSGTVSSFGNFPFPVLLSAGIIEGDDGNFYGTGSSYPFGDPYYFGKGFVFQMSKSGSVNVIYQWPESTNPNNPSGSSAGVIQASDGYLYGTTPDTVFRVSRHGGFTVLYKFPTWFEETVSGLIETTDGHLYGTTSAHNPNDPSIECGTVFRITLQGEFTIVHNFTPGIACTPLGGVIEGADGNLYGTTSFSDVQNQGTAKVFRINRPSGRVTVYNISVAGLTQANDGYLYAISDVSLVRISLDGQVEALGTIPQFGGYGGYGGLVQAVNGNLYGTTPYGGDHPGGERPSGGTVFEFNLAGNFTLLYSFKGDGRC